MKFCHAFLQEFKNTEIFQLYMNRESWESCVYWLNLFIAWTDVELVNLKMSSMSWKDELYSATNIYKKRRRNKKKTEPFLRSN
jgi:hypothetical protein